MAVAIYALTDPRTNTIRYVGQGVDPRARLTHHVWEARKGASRTHKCRWLQSIDCAPGMHVLEWVNDTDADEAECRWMSRFDNLTNHAPGGTKPPVMVGERNPRTRLSDSDVRALREGAAAEQPMAELATRFNITRASATQIVTGQTRVTAGGPIRAPKIKKRLSEADVTEIRRRAAAGESQSSLAAHFKVHVTHVNHIVHLRSRRQSATV